MTADINLSKNYPVPPVGSSRSKEKSWVKPTLIGIAIGYLGLVLFIPTVNVFYQAFKKGLEPFFANLTSPDFLSAAQLTLLIALIVVPVNTIFGLCAAWVIGRNKFHGRTLLITILEDRKSVV